MFSSLLRSGETHLYALYCGCRLKQISLLVQSLDQSWYLSRFGGLNMQIRNALELIKRSFSVAVSEIKW